MNRGGRATSGLHEKIRNLLTQLRTGIGKMPFGRVHADQGGG